jgi:hypothetical protein
VFFHFLTLLGCKQNETIKRQSLIARALLAALFALAALRCARCFARLRLIARSKSSLKALKSPCLPFLPGKRLKIAQSPIALKTPYKRASSPQDAL